MVLYPPVRSTFSNRSKAEASHISLLNLAVSLPSERCSPMVSEVKQNVDQLSFSSCPAGLLE